MEDRIKTYSVRELRQGITLGTGQHHILRIDKCPSDSFKGAFSCRCWRARTDPVVANVLKRVLKLIKVDERFGLDDDGAARALRHYLNGSGDFVEIPAEKAKAIRRTWEAQHLKTAYSRFILPQGCKAALALRALTRDARAIAVNQWPDTVELEMSYADGPPEGGVLSGLKSLLSAEHRDDLTEYFGARIWSTVLIACGRLPGHSHAFSLSIKRWRSHVIDNYDWEGDKAFLNFPTQAEMRRLAEVGCARPYQRSSESWNVETSQFAPWIASFDPPEHLTTEQYVEGYANLRREKERQESRDDERDKASGALSPPGPAETMTGRKQYWWFEPDDPDNHTCV